MGDWAEVVGQKERERRKKKKKENVKRERRFLRDGEEAMAS